MPGNALRPGGRVRLLIPLLLVAFGLGACHRPAARKRAPAPAPPPPPGTYARISVAPLPETLARLAAFGRAMQAWTLTADDLWLPVREALGALSDLAREVDWSRPLHLLARDPRPQKGRLIGVLPVKKPRAALTALGRRCTGTRQGRGVRFTGGGTGWVACRFYARAVPGGLVVARKPADVDAAVAYATYLLRPGAPTPASLEARLYPDALRARLGLTPDKLKQWVDTFAVGLAVALGDFTAAGELKPRLAALVKHLDSVYDVGVSLAVHPDALQVRLFATGRPGGALARWIAGVHPRPLRLHHALGPRAPVVLGLARTGPLPTPSDKKPEAAPGPLVDLVTKKLPAPLRTPARVLWTLLDRDAGEVAAALRTQPGGGLAVVALLEEPRPQAVRARWERVLKGLIAGLRSLPGVARTGALKVHAETKGRVTHLRVTLGPPTTKLWAALRWLAGGDTLSIALATGPGRLAVAVGAGAEARVRQALKKAPHAPVAPENKAAPQFAGRLGLVRLSLVELSRLVPGLVPDEGPAPKDAGALTLHWGVVPLARQVEVGLRLPARHLQASAAVWSALMKRLDEKAEALPAWLTNETEPEDAL